MMVCLRKRISRAAVFFPLFVSVACGSGESRPPNVLIISLESVRSDHLGVAGYHRPVSPNIDQLAARGTFFTRAYSQATWTRPSIASMFTSTYQSSHGVLGETGQGLPIQERQLGEHSVLAETFDTLAEIFHEEGYRTYGWTGNPQLWSGLGFAQGFDEYRAVGVNDRQIMKNLRGVFSSSERPFFAFVQFMATHQPYRPRKRFRRYDTNPNAVLISADTVRQINDGELELTPEDVEHNIALYDATIAQVDEALGEVLQDLQDARLTDETVIVLTADHGEEFYERGRVAHGATPYETLIHVPLVMAGPGISSGNRVDVPVQSIDIFPTLTSLVLGRLPEVSQGRDLSRVLGGNDLVAQPVFAEHWGQRAVIDGAWKYLVLAGKSELYNLVNDPDERIDLVDDVEYQAVRERLAQMLDRFVAANQELALGFDGSGSGEFPDDVLEKLRSLGYIR